MQTLVSLTILWGMRDYAHADGNGNHGNLWRIMAKHTKKLGTGISSTAHFFNAVRRPEKYGVGLLFMAFWHGLRWIIGLQCSIGIDKRDARCVKDYKEL